MRVRILGSAAGGGLPQWNCACDGCTTARRSGANRTQDGVAVTGDGTAWYLINASPDLRTQLLSTGDLDPGPGRRDTPIRGVLLTTAELDHTIGLFGLREAERLDVYATPTILAALPAVPILRRYTDLHLHELTGEPLTLDGGLTVHALTVGAKRPRYADPGRGDAWVSALRLLDQRTGRSFVYATCLPTWTDAFDAFLAGADVALLDGTFSTEDEPARAAGLTRTPRDMGHLPIADALPELRHHPGVRFLFGHLNNTNPFAAGPAPVDVAHDGQELLL
ncbi:pyrroloquinoline quinone biosynthesis protein PqqB [Dactylosporangium cerinum]|uniref:Coenzyme PQQ synthesis protein B n=1 Tax=Dactylosporangium cerinum TaxID=1434730 RepID=A0ABV9VYC0_9ACTN